MDLVQDRWGASVLSTRPAPGSWYLFFLAHSRWDGVFRTVPTAGTAFLRVDSFGGSEYFLFCLLHWYFSVFFDVRLPFGRVAPFVQCKFIGWVYRCTRAT